ncbi:MAG TPA: hypothetical protein VHZ31_06385 [Solirubrobacteraceae bacterium]|jgi:hypothetical protein|nr:hypothetical protein [Solirubrobacteraceae bacterium]
MRLDLAQLKEMHPAIPLARAADLSHCAALGLQRNGHAPGARLRARLDAINHDTALDWTAADDEARTQLDRHRITEDAAEAISLALVSVALSWVIRRRGQRGDHADWIMRDPEGNRIALEVSGIDAGDHAHRLRDKARQVGRSLADQRAACVVELATPLAALATTSVEP